MNPLSWCEINTTALTNNINQLKHRLAPQVALMPVIKANAYGHGLLLAAQTFMNAGADWLAVNSLDEGIALRQASITAPVCILGYVSLANLDEVVRNNLRPIVYNQETLHTLAKVAVQLNQTVGVHLKVETGCNRQGVSEEDALKLALWIAKTPGIYLEGLCSHFANVEDTTNHTYANQQSQRFDRIVTRLEGAGCPVPIRHISNSAAALLWSRKHCELVRAGIACYGLWPSKETRVSVAMEERPSVRLEPALTWKTRIAQVKTIGSEEYIGYGCTYQTTHPTRLAILPVGYYNGYDRKLSNVAFTIIHGKRAPIRGRVCMNMIMVDITNIPQARLEDEVILLGKMENQQVTAEMMADWAGTINYEITTRIAEHIPRISV